jgi:hypothetical protein
MKVGDLSILDEDTAQAIREIASHPSIVALSKELGVDPFVAVIGLAAREASSRNRSAARIAKAIFRGKDLAAIATAMRAIGL